MQATKTTAFVLAFLATGAAPAVAGTLTVCAEHYNGDGPDFADEFAHGPITVPAGAVFDYAGHTFNGPMDPKDESHRPADGGDWVGIDAAEKSRRRQLIGDDMSTDSLAHGHHSAAVTMAPVVLTKRRLCAPVRAEAFVSRDWRDDAQVLFAAPEIYFQSYGVVRHGELDTGFDDDANPFDHASTRGELNAVVSKTLDRAFTLPTDDTDTEPYAPTP